MSRAAPTIRNVPDERADAYAALGRFSTFAIGGAMGVGIRGSIVRQYVRNFLRENGRFPLGRHNVRGNYGSSVISFETLFPGKTTAALAAFGHRLGRDELWGPPPLTRMGVFVRAKKAYPQSPERQALRAWLLGQVEDALRNLPAGGAH